ncbi:MAG: aminotransferase class I/II-fold pyridoxal phosphate-dependent enzyme [Oscillospiraceae bacterium]|jgi:8-amino-7-oxononanoate synthase/acyl carrier protein|nr:aminotransferase class I/II-fold pyridoxal phosphate-dependent enzyme [Oscillospiraceae bacterium]
MTRHEKLALLEKDKTLRGFFGLLGADETLPAAIWLDGEAECSYTYGDFRARALACAARVQATGLGEQGGFVGIAVDTCPDWPILFWGLLAAGRQPLLIDPSLDDPPIAHLLRQAGAKALIARRKRLLAGVQQSLPEALLGDDAPAPGFKPTWADRVALCTSGTTETARVFVYNGQALCMQVIGFMQAHEDHPIVKEKRGLLTTLCFLPLNHVFGLVVHVLWAAFLGFPQVYLKDRSPQTILETCRKTRVQMILAVPLLINNLAVTLKKRIAKEAPAKRLAFSTMVGMSLQAQRVNPRAGLALGRKLFHSINEKLFGDTLEFVVVGGSHTPVESLRLINALGYAVVLGFGMTEVGVTSCELSLDLENRLTGSVGYPLPISAYTVRPDGDDPARGELLIRTAARHTARMVDGEERPADVDAEGYYATGDVVRLGEKGRMYVEGRTKDVIIGESGENVYPDELEDAFANLDGVEQLCVLGTKEGDSPYDVTTLVLSVGAHYADEAFLRTLAEKVQTRSRTLSPIKRIKRVLATPEALPVVNTIKVKRLALREMIEGRRMAYRPLNAQGAPGEAIAPQKAELPEPAQPTDDLALEEIRQKVRAAFAEVLEMDLSAIGDEAHFIDDLGGDSLQSLGVSLKIEEIFSITIPMEEYTACTSVNDLSALIYAHLRGNGPYAAEAVRDEKAEIKPITRFEDTPEYAAFAKRLQGMEGQKNPYFVCHDSPLKDTSLMGGREVLNFGSYNYAGMSGRKETMEAAKAAIDQYGTSASGSRLLAGEKSLYQELEREIAKWKHAEASLVLVGGHSTNVTVVGNFCGKDDLIVYDAISHNSVQEGCRLSGATSKPFPHNDTQALEGILRMHRHKYAKALIIVEGAYSMDGDIAPVPRLVELKKQYGCFLMVDEAHSACVIGRTGGGVDEYFGLKHDDIDIKMGTLSKGLGTCGGYLAGKRALIDYFRYSLPGFVFSVGISPPLAAATLAAVRALQEHPEIMEQLRQNISTFMEAAHARGLNTCLAKETAIVPILVGRDEDAFALSNALGERGVFVPPAVYPAVPKNKARLRFCVISEHKPEQIIRALDILIETAAELGIALPPTAA